MSSVRVAEMQTSAPALVGLPTPVTVLGVPFAAVDYAGGVARVRGLLTDGGTHQVVIANAHTLNLAARDPAYHAVLRGAALVLRDGVGIEIAATLRRGTLPYNFVGTDFVPDVLADLGDLEPTVFLYGAAPGVAEEAASALCRRAPRCRVVGTADGFGDADAVARRIAALRPDVLLVALGNPLQERWIAMHLQELNVRLAIGVGALFDYLAGRVPRAPGWVRALRSEWLFRLVVEPTRLWRRYVVGNAVFLWRVLAATPGERA